MDIKRIVVGPLQTNCYLLAANGELAVIDPGGDAIAIAEEVAQIKASPKLIIATHGHFDHTGAIKELRENYGIPFLAGENEKEISGIAPDRLLKEGEEVMIGAERLKIVNTPGHTRGGICIFTDNFVMSGDTLFSDSIGRTDLAGGSDSDMAASLKKLDGLIPDGSMVYPGHGEPFKYQKGMALVWIDYLY